MVLLKNRIKYLTPSQKYVIKLYPPPNDAMMLDHRQYRYKFSGFPVQDDPVIRFIKNTIRQLSQENISVSTVSYKIEALTDQPPIWPLTLNNAHQSSKLYAIKESFNEFPYSISVAVQNRSDSSPLAMDRVLVRMNKDEAPKSLKGFLVDLAGGGHPGLSAAQAQYKWWSTNGKTFRFLDLPEELRLKLLVHILGPTIRPHTVTRSQLPEQVVLGSKRQNPDWSSGESLDYPDYAIFRVSKQVHLEAKMAGWTGTQKLFHGVHTLFRVLRCPNQPIQPNALSKIVLVFTFGKYFTLLGFDVTPTVVRGGGTPVAEVLQQSYSLTDLTMIFPALDYEYPSNPWQELVDWRNPQIRNIQKRPCHRVIIDWILTFAYPYVKHIPRVHLQGFIKTVTKTKWDHIFRNEYLLSQGKNYDHHGFIYHTALDVILSEPASALAPRCFCPKSCVVKLDWHPSGRKLRDEERRWRLANDFDFDDTFREEDFEAFLEPLETAEVQNATFPLIPDRKFLEENDRKWRMEVGAAAFWQARRFWI